MTALTAALNRNKKLGSANQLCTIQAFHGGTCGCQTFLHRCLTNKICLARCPRRTNLNFKLFCYTAVISCCGHRFLNGKLTMWCASSSSEGALWYCLENDLNINRKASLMGLLLTVLMSQLRDRQQVYAPNSLDASQQRRNDLLVS